MLFPQVDPKEWTKIYDLEIPKAVCRKCQAGQEFNTPFAYKEFRGLLSDHTECGEEFRQSVFVTVNKQQRISIGQIVKRAILSVDLLSK